MKKLKLFFTTIIFLIGISLYSQTWVESQKISSLTENDRFGTSIDVDGDLLAISASVASIYSSDSNYVKLFQKTGNTWNEIAELRPSILNSSNFAFGQSILIDNDKIFIGAHRYYDGTNKGAIYVFEKPTNGWTDMTETSILFPPEQLGGSFGYSIVCDNNYLVIGAPNLNGLHGKVYIYDKSSVSYISKLESGQPTNDWNFGFSIAIEFNTIFVGAPRYSNTYNYEGKIFIFQHNGTNWPSTPTGSAVSSNPQLNDKLGFSVAVSNNVLVSGCPKTNSLNSVGKALVFENPAGIGSLWSYNSNESAVLSPSNYPTDENIVFGFSVDKVNEKILIGSFSYFQESSGKAYVFEKPITGWDNMTETYEITVNDSSDQCFGCYVKLKDENEFFVSSMQDSENATNNGAVYNFNFIEPVNISTQPQNSNVCNYSFISFEVQAENAINYQWQISEDNGLTFTNLTDNNYYTGSQTNILSVNAIESFDSNLYHCIVSNSYYSDTSDNAILTIIDDTEPPVITSTHNNLILYSDNNCEIVLPDFTGDIIATDNCDDTLEYSQNPNPGSILSNSSIVTLYTIDNDGNFDSVNFELTLIDTISPVIVSTYENLEIDADENCETIIDDYLIGIIATDNCDNDLEFFQSPLPGSIISGENNIVSLSVYDDSGNFDEVEFNVSVIDNTNPDITSIHEDMTVDANENCEYEVPDFTIDLIAIDNCDDNLEFEQTPVTGSLISGSNNLITLTVLDDNGNFDEISFTIDVIDNSNPIITSIHNDIEIDANENCEAILPDFTNDLIATDNCDDNLIIEQYPLPGNIFSGTLSVTLTVIDNNGNFDEVEFNVSVIDNTNPIIECNSDDSIELEESETYYIVQGTEYDPISTSDNCQIDYIENDFNYSSTLSNAELPIGTNLITWTVYDISGNQNTCTTSIEVIAFDNVNEIEKLISVYPNPVKNKLFIDLKPLNVHEMNLINSIGVTIKSINNVLNIESIDCSDIESGSYILIIKTNNEIITKKIIKE